uniref:Uncharacterized protein n=1 Tax=Panagrolaimus superbus TaxID=310955 RepID=A0A914YSD0_9BILA
MPKTVIDDNIKRGQKGKRAGLWVMPNTNTNFTCKMCYPDDECDHDMEFEANHVFMDDEKIRTIGVGLPQLRNHMKKQHWVEYLVCYGM